MNELRDIAQKLARRRYITMVFLDETTDEGTIYVAINPELGWCIAQGETVPDARHNLDETRVDFILDMLEDGEDVPEPRTLDTAIFNLAPCISV